MTTALLTSLLQLLLTGLAVCTVFAVGALWQARTTRYWRDRAVAAERAAVTSHVRIHPASSAPRPGSIRAVSRRA